MTTPDLAGAPEDLGVLEIFGMPASTFTRSIKLGLHELNIHYVDVTRQAHSEDIKARNPYGLLPVLVHRPDGLYTQPGEIVTLYESNAIRRYIDELLAPLAQHPSKGAVRALTPALTQTAGTPDPAAVILRARLDGFVSSFSQTLFPALEGGYIKPAAQMKKNGAELETINVALEPGLQRIHTLLEVVESQAKAHNHAKESGWILGSAHPDISWADLFLFPILDDLRASPAGNLISGPTPTFPWLAAWLARLDARPSVKLTHEGTVAHQTSKSA